MKKLSILLLLTIPMTPALCMNNNNNKYKYPSMPLLPYSLSFPIPLFPTPIATSYELNSFCKNSTRNGLEEKKSIEEKKNTSIALSQNKHPHRDIIKKLYNTTYTLIATIHNDKFYNQKTGLQQLKDDLSNITNNKSFSPLTNKLIYLVYDVYQAKRMHNLTEEDVINYIYQNAHNEETSYTILYFRFLEEYMRGIDNKKQLVMPQIFNLLNNRENSKECNTQPLIILANKLYNIIIIPSYDYNKIPCHIRKQIDTFNSFLHLKLNDSLRDDYFDGSYTHLKNEFYSKIYHVLYKTNSQCHYAMDKTLYHIIQMVQKAKDKNDIQEEQDLRYSLPESQQTEVSLSTQLSDFFTNLLDNTPPSLFPTDNSHFMHQINVFCELLKQYNQSNKITATPQQYFVYTFKKEYQIPLPNKNVDYLFDENYYAFNEFHYLKEKVKIVRDCRPQDIEQCSTQL